MWLIMQLHLYNAIYTMLHTDKSTLAKVRSHPICVREGFEFESETFPGTAVTSTPYGKALDKGEH
jgi:hypothetical protein